MLPIYQRWCVLDGWHYWFRQRKAAVNSQKIIKRLTKLFIAPKTPSIINSLADVCEVWVPDKPRTDPLPHHPPLLPDLKPIWRDYAVPNARTYRPKTLQTQLFSCKLVSSIWIDENRWSTLASLWEWLIIITRTQKILRYFENIAMIYDSQIACCCSHHW